MTATKPKRAATGDSKPSTAAAPQSAAAPSPFPPIANYAKLMCWVALDRAGRIILVEELEAMGA